MKPARKSPRLVRSSNLNKDFNIIGYWGLALLIAAIYSILSLVTPYYLDDWGFMGIWRDDAAGGDSFSFPTWGRYYEFIRGFDNGRISNALSPLSTMFSPWKEVFPYLTGIFAAFSIVMTQRFAWGKRKILPLVLTWAFFIVCLPWKDTLFVRDYSLNYIWAGALTLAFLWCLKIGEGRGWSPALVILCAFLAVLAGGWHEGFAVPTLCGLALLAVVRRFRFSRSFYLIFAIYLVSAVIFMASPGMISRIGNSLADSRHLLAYRHFFIIFLPALLLIFNAFFRRGREILLELWKSDSVIVGTGIIISGLFIGIMTVNTPRSFYWPDMAAIMVSLFMICRWSPTSSRRWSITKGALAFILTTLCTAQSVLAIIWQQRYTEDWKHITSQLEHSKSGIVFYDMTLPARAPRWTLGIPYAEAWRSPFHMRLIQSYYNTPMIGVVPTALKRATLNEALPLDGKPELRLYGENLISKFEKIDTTTHVIVPAFRELDVVLPDGREEKGIYVATPFINEKGDTLLYYVRW